MVMACWSTAKLFSSDNLLYTGVLLPEISHDSWRNGFIKPSAQLASSFEQYLTYILTL